MKHGVYFKLFSNGFQGLTTTARMEDVVFLNLLLLNLDIFFFKYYSANCPWLIIFSVPLTRNNLFMLTLFLHSTVQQSLLIQKIISVKQNKSSCYLKRECPSLHPLPFLIDTQCLKKPAK